MKDIFNDFPYFGQLVKINNVFFSNEKNYNIRLYNVEDLMLFDSLLEEFDKVLNNCHDVDTVLLSLLNLVGKLLYLQPFYDGNSRTLKQFIVIVLNKLGYDLSFNNDDFIIPMLFDEDECTYEEVSEFKNNVGLRKKG